MTDIDKQRIAAMTNARTTLLKLSPADRDKYNRDVAVFGSACVRELEDGSVVYVPLSEWVDGKIPGGKG